MKRALDWRYAVGEFLLIVAGILVAMAASDWQERRNDRQRELTILTELHGALSVDRDTLEHALGRVLANEGRLDRLVRYLKSDAPYVDSLDSYFGTVYSFQFIDLNNAGYESLKSQGLELISDDGLRSHISQVYERSYPTAITGMAMERDVVLDVLRPYFLVHFRDLRFNQSATPVDPDALMKDGEFLNLVAYDLESLRRARKPRLERAIAEIAALVEALDREVAR